MWKSSGGFLALVLGFCAVAAADLAPNPKPPRPPTPPRVVSGNAEMIIRIDPQAKEARLEIPAKLLPRQGDAGTVPNQSGIGSISATRTILAGLALSAGIASLVLLRRRRAAGLAGAAAVGLAALLVASAADANVAPVPIPSPLDEPAGAPLTAAAVVRELGDPLGRNVAGQVRIEVSNTANVVTLVLPKGTKEPAPNAAPKSAPGAAAPKPASDAHP